MSQLALSVARPSAPVVKVFTDGTHRAATPADTLARVAPLFPMFGITRVANVTGLDRIGLPVVMVCRPNSRSLAVSQGKGVTLDAAKASGVMEAIELWHAEHVSRPLKLGSQREMGRLHTLCDVGQLAHTCSGQYDPDLPTLWLEGVDLLSDEDVWLPFETVHTNATLTPLPGQGSFASSSNGLASGNEMLEALTHAVCEVVERDATTLWRLAGAGVAERTLLDLDTVDDAACRFAIGRCQDAGCAVMAWDVTSDTGIPAFACLITDLHSVDQHMRSAAMGMGCHPTREVALLRAVTEAAQSRLTLIAGSRDDLLRTDYQDSPESQSSLALYRAQARQGPGPRRFADVPSHRAGSFDEDLAWLLNRLRAIGASRVLAVDLTDPRIGVPVVRVVVPGLEAPDNLPGYNPGRRARALVGTS